MSAAVYCMKDIFARRLYGTQDVVTYDLMAAIFAFSEFVNVDSNFFRVQQVADIMTLVVWILSQSVKELEKWQPWIWRLPNWPISFHQSSVDEDCLSWVHGHRGQYVSVQCLLSTRRCHAGVQLISHLTCADSAFCGRAQYNEFITLYLGADGANVATRSTAY